jgi:hypothetical protein
MLSIWGFTVFLAEQAKLIAADGRPGSGVSPRHRLASRFVTAEAPGGDSGPRKQQTIPSHFPLVVLRKMRDAHARDTKRRI